MYIYISHPTSPHPSTTYRPTRSVDQSGQAEFGNFFDQKASLLFQKLLPFNRLCAFQASSQPSDHVLYWWVYYKANWDSELTVATDHLNSQFRIQYPYCISLWWPTRATTSIPYSAFQTWLQTFKLDSRPSNLISDFQTWLQTFKLDFGPLNSIGKPLTSDFQTWLWKPLTSDFQTPFRNLRLENCKLRLWNWETWEPWTSDFQTGIWKHNFRLSSSACYTASKR